MFEICRNIHIWISFKIALAIGLEIFNNSQAQNAGGFHLLKDGGRSSVGRATDCGSVGRGFETLRPPHLILPFVDR